MTGAVHGVSEVIAALDKILAQVEAGNLRIIKRSQAVVNANIKKQFTGAHRKGTPTTSSPGSPPDVVTGTLRRSIISEAPTMSGFTARGRVYPSMIYGRIQELGGRGLPPRPYTAPGLAASTSAIQAIAVEEWGKATSL